jgi:hypothetical protein
VQHTPFIIFREESKNDFGIELINKYFKSHCARKGIWYNKEFSRFYFAKQNEEAIETETRDNCEKKIFRKEKNRSKKKRETERGCNQLQLLRKTLFL